MRTIPRWARTVSSFTVLILATLAGGAALPAAEPDPATESTARKYTATACLMVEWQEPHILSQAAGKFDPAEFECFRTTQMQLLKSRLVLTAALRNPKLRGLPGVLREDARHRALAWLHKEIRVECPDERTGIITVSVSNSNPEEAAALVNAVVDAYMNEVVNYDRQMRRDRLSDLQQICAEKENEVRTKREQLKQVVESVGAATSPAEAAIRQQLATDKCLLLQKELLALRSEYQRALGDLKVQKAAGGDTKRLEAQNDSLRELLAAREKEYDRAYGAAVAEGAASIAATMAAEEVRLHEQVLRTVTVEREMLRIELHARPRVRVIGDPNTPAAVPECAD